MDFHSWLQKQEDRGDEIGVLARRLLHDPISPFWSNRICTYRIFLIFRNADETLGEPLEAAFGEWRACTKTGTGNQTTSFFRNI